MVKEKKTLIGQATPEQIDDWKKKHGDVFSAQADSHIAYFVKPSRQQLSYAMSIENDRLKFLETIFKSCCVGGSDIFLTETEYLLGAAELLGDLVAAKKVELGKL